MRLKNLTKYTTKSFETFVMIEDTITASDLTRKSGCTHWTMNRWKGWYLEDGLIKFLDEKKNAYKRPFKLTSKGKKIKELLLEMNTVLR